MALFGTLLTWIFSVTAAADNSAVSATLLCDSSFFDDDEVNEICNLCECRAAVPARESRCRVCLSAMFSSRQFVCAVYMVSYLSICL